MIVLAELYEALIEAGASEEKARAAARAAVDLCRRPIWGENLLPSIEPRFNVVYWMIGGLLFVVGVVLLVKLSNC